MNIKAIMFNKYLCSSWCSVPPISHMGKSNFSYSHMSSKAIKSYFFTFPPLYFEGWSLFSTQEHEVSSNYREKSLDIPLTAYITNIPRPESKNWHRGNCYQREFSSLRKYGVRFAGACSYCKQIMLLYAVFRNFKINWKIYC